MAGGSVGTATGSRLFAFRRQATANRLTGCTHLVHSTTQRRDWGRISDVRHCPPRDARREVAPLAVCRMSGTNRGSVLLQRNSLPSMAWFVAGAVLTGGANPCRLTSSICTPSQGPSSGDHSLRLGLGPSYPPEHALLDDAEYRWYGKLASREPRLH